MTATTEELLTALLELELAKFECSDDNAKVTAAITTAKNTLSK